VVLVVTWATITVRRPEREENGVMSHPSGWGGMSRAGWLYRLAPTKTRLCQCARPPLLLAQPSRVAYAVVEL